MIPIFLTSSPNGYGKITSNISSIISLDPNIIYEVGLLSVSIWNSIYNISVDLGNNILRYSNDNGVSWFDLTLPDGNYSLSELNRMIDHLLDVAGHGTGNIRFDGYASTNKLKMLLGANFQVEFTNYDLRLVLGFNSALYAATTMAPNECDFQNGIRQVYVRCNLVYRSIKDDANSSVLYSFAMPAPSNSLFYNVPAEVIWVPMHHTEYIQTIVIDITDQNNRVLTFNKEYEITLAVRSSPIYNIATSFQTADELTIEGDGMRKGRVYGGGCGARRIKGYFG